jgi:hypothetical protein
VVVVGVACVVGSSLELCDERCMEVWMTGGRTYSFFRRRGRVGTNFIFWVPALVVSAGIFARLAMALPVFDWPGVPDIVV